MIIVGYCNLKKYCMHFQKIKNVNLEHLKLVIIKLEIVRKLM